MLRAMPDNETDDAEDDDLAQLERRALTDYSDVDLGGVSMGAGGMIGGVGMASSVPAATPENFICLRGPCRHYWQTESYLDSGNPDGTFDGPNGLKDADGNPIRKPRQIGRACTVAVPETELTEGLIYDCNRWDPLLPSDTKDRAKRVEKFYRIHPRLRPAP